MKILVISMNSIHTNRWLSQLKSSHHEIYYFEALGGSYNKGLSWVNYQHYEWRSRLGNFKGKYLLKNKIPFLYKLLLKKPASELNKVVKNIQPDVIHSFSFYISCSPFYEVIKNYKNIKWIYSAWGNDLFFNQHILKYKKDIDFILPKIDYLFADCTRDLVLANKLGFRGKVLGNFPGGGGYKLRKSESLKNTLQRCGIIMKGYEGPKHKAINVLSSLHLVKDFPNVTILSAEKSVVNFVKTNFNNYKEKFTIYAKGENIPHSNLMNMFNDSLIYISNNLSDGMPNTLLEAISNGAFPIQSNPGGASEEIITHGENGLLIEDCEDIEEIKERILTALQSPNLIDKAFEKNMELRKKLDYEHIRKQVLEKYELVEKELLC